VDAMDMSDLLTLVLRRSASSRCSGQPSSGSSCGATHPTARTDRDDRGSGLPGERGRRVA
jgi:hypothetical protein